MKKLMWGAAASAIAKKTASGYGEFKRLPEMVEGSLALNTTKGEKKEAKVEGGGVEAVKYGKNTYDLTANYRRGAYDDGSPVTFPFDNDELDGVVDGVYALRVQPEDKDAGGLAVREVIISTEDQFTAADGAIKVVKYDFIKPELDANGVQIPTIDWSPIPNLLAEMEALPVYTKVANPTESPKDSNYFEATKKGYVASTDTIVATGKTYYTVATDGE